MLPPLEERPLVTFALFAYNQEKYIREAVEGAFAQTYEPLEIILSDDCSTDRTFEIMEEMTKSYSGPHRVAAIRQSRNVGTIDHMLSVSAISQGKLIVVAAGDDISVPERTAKIVEHWIGANPSILYSGRIIIDENGVEQGIESSPTPMSKIQRIFEGTTCARRYDGMVRNVPGYSAAYSREFLNQIPKSGICALNEDALTTVLGNIDSHEIEAIPAPLVSYRLAETSVSPRGASKSFYEIREDENRVIRFSRSSVVFYPYLFEAMKASKTSKEELDLIKGRLQEIYREAILITKSADSGFLRRLLLLTKCRSPSEIRILIPRLFGINIFSTLKYLAK